MRGIYIIILNWRYLSEEHPANAGVYYYFVLNVNICQHTSLGNPQHFSTSLYVNVFIRRVLGLILNLSILLA